MTTPTAPPSARLPRPDPGEEDLDSRIRRAELQLIAREEGLQRRVAALGGRVHEVASPRRWLAPAIGTLVATATLRWVWTRRGAATRRVLPKEAPSAAPAGSSWLGLLGLAMPLLPPPWRERLNAATRGTVIAIGRAVFEKLRERRTPPPAAPRRPLNQD
jgi:hypothetical protein